MSGVRRRHRADPNEESWPPEPVSALTQEVRNRQAAALYLRAAAMADGATASTFLRRHAAGLILRPSPRSARSRGSAWAYARGGVACVLPAAGAALTLGSRRT